VDRINAGHRQDAARLQAVHVVADEGVRIRAVQRDQHHVERDVDGLELGGDAAEAVAGLDAVLAAMAPFAGCDCRTRRHVGILGGRTDAAALRTLGRGLVRGRGLCGRFRARTRRRLMALAWRDLGRLRRAQLGRIEQEGVLAHQAAVGPRQFQQHVDERLVERLARRHADELTATTLLDVEAQRQQRRIEVDVGGAEGLGRSQLGRQAGCLLGRHRGQLDLGAQRLAERGQHGQLAQTGRMGRGHQDHCTGNRRGELLQRGRLHRKAVSDMHSRNRLS
jgi:hypothetical protein